jgi:hypothetical protein
VKVVNHGKQLHTITNICELIQKNITAVQKCNKKKYMANKARWAATENRLKDRVQAPFKAHDQSTLYFQKTGILK